MIIDVRPFRRLPESRLTCVAVLARPQSLRQCYCHVRPQRHLPLLARNRTSFPFPLLASSPRLLQNIRALAALVASIGPLLPAFIAKIDPKVDPGNAGYLFFINWLFDVRFPFPVIRNETDLGWLVRSSLLRPWFTISHPKSSLPKRPSWIRLSWARSFFLILSTHQTRPSRSKKGSAWHDVRKVLERILERARKESPPMFNINKDAANNSNETGDISASHNIPEMHTCRLSDKEVARGMITGGCNKAHST